MSSKTLTGRAGTPCRPSGAQGTARPTAASPVSRGYHAGIVKWYNQQLAYGYISVAPSVKAKLRLPVEGDLYVRATGISGFPKQLNSDDRVEFEVVEGSRGFRAVNVRVRAAALPTRIENVTD